MTCLTIIFKQCFSSVSTGYNNNYSFSGLNSNVYVRFYKYEFSLVNSLVTKFLRIFTLNYILINVLVKLLIIYVVHILILGYNEVKVKVKIKNTQLKILKK